MKKIIKSQNIITCLFFTCLLLFFIGCEEDETKYSLKLDIMPVGSGTVDLSPSGGTYPEGTEVSLSPNPSSNYKFTSWSGTDASYVNNNKIVMSKNMDVIANFEMITYSLKLNILPVGSGTVDLSPSGDTYADGTVVNLTAKSNLGYFFSEWSGDASGTLNPITITMNSDKTIGLIFKEGVFEDFNDGVADYFITDGSGRWNVTNNAYVMTGTNSNTVGYSYYPYKFSDFGLSVDMKVTKSGTSAHAFGIYFKSQSAYVKLNSYRLSISRDGRWYFGIYINSTFTFITDGWIQSSNLNTGLNATNNIKVLFIGTQVHIYFNDVYQGYASNLSDFAQGYAGVLGYDDDDYDNEYSFDNFEIVTTDINSLKSTLPLNNIDYDLTNIKGIKGDPDGK